MRKECKNGKGLLQEPCLLKKKYKFYPVNKVILKDFKDQNGEHQIYIFESPSCHTDQIIKDD